MIYDRGDVVLLPFPCTDQSGSKKRPAIILSTAQNNSRRSDIVVAPITSNVLGSRQDDTKLLDWGTAGLLKPSVVKGILGTVEQSLVIRMLGKATENDLFKVNTTIAYFLGLVTFAPHAASATPPESSSD